MTLSLGKGLSSPFSLGSVTVSAAVSSLGFFRVRADGVTDKIAGSGASGPTGAADSSRGILSVRFEFPIGASAREDIVNLGSSDSTRFAVYKQTDQTIRLTAFDSTPTEILTLDANTTVSADGSMHHLWSSWQTDALGSAGDNDYRMWLDGADVTEYVTQSSANASADIEYTVPWTFLGRDAGDFFLNAYVSELYFAPGQFLDPTVTANVFKFTTSAGSAVSLGASGATPTGTGPAVYFRRGVSAWHVNQGTIADGGFKLVGALVSAGEL